MIVRGREWHDPCPLNVYCSVSTTGEELNCRRWGPSRANASPTCAAFSTSLGIRGRQDTGEGIKESRDQAIRESRGQETQAFSIIEEISEGNKLTKRPSYSLSDKVICKYVASQDGSRDLQPEDPSWSSVLNLGGVGTCGRRS